MPELSPDEDTAPPADPFEAELVAYLDGELDLAASRRVEARLAADPQARARATALKKTFELLDYLPRPEPSATFASRTVDKLPALQTESPKPAAAPEASQQQPKPARVSQPVAAVVPSQRATAPSMRLQSAMAVPAEPAHSRRWIWAASLVVAAAGFAAAGYFGGSAIRSSQSNPAANKDGADELTLSDRRLIEYLPLYAVVDDYSFVNEVARPDYFGNDAAVSFDPKWNVKPEKADAPAKTSGNTFAAMEKAFKQLPPKRQQAIRDLDKQLYSDREETRNHLLRVMEAYAAWLNLLSENDRRQVLAAAAPELRLKLIREIRERQWVETLPPGQQKQLSVASADLQRKLIEEWKAEESRRRDEWINARKNASSQLDISKAPWPFDTETRRNEVIAFAKNAFRLEDNKDSRGSRLTANELERYTSALNFATAQGGAAWGMYGKTLYELLKRPETSTGKPLDELLLPPPEHARLRFTDFPELPQPFQNQRVMQILKKRVTPFVGKWPEFPLEVHKDVPQIHKEGFGKFDFPKVDLKTIALGPARISEFAPEVRKFVDGELIPKLTEGEKRNLGLVEGKWPDYPRELLRLSRTHDLSMPGVMLPGSPKKWEDFYGFGRNK